MKARKPAIIFIFFILFILEASVSFASVSLNSPPDGINILQSGNEITVSWDPVSWDGVDKYQVTLYRTGTSSDKTYKSTSCDADETSTDMTISQKGYYYARVRAKDVNNNYTEYSEKSEEITVTSSDIGSDSKSYSVSNVGASNPYEAMTGTSVSNTAGTAASNPYEAMTGTSSSNVSGQSGTTGSNASNPYEALTGSQNTGSYLTSQSSLCPSSTYSVSNAEIKNVYVNSYQNYGWQFENDGIWYLFPDGTYLINSWLKTEYGMQHFDERGYLQISTWIYEPDGEWYYVDEKGVMARGWKEISGKYYLFSDNNGALIGPGLIVSDGKYYYINTNGQRAENVWIDGFYFDQNGVRVN